jgi:hypothetical protein
MDNILHYTDPTLTLVAAVSFVVTLAFPLSFEAIAAVSALHVAAGDLTALIIGRFNRPLA